MKKLIYICTGLAFIGSMSLVGGKALAAPSAATMVPVRVCVDGPVGVPGDAHIVQGMYKGVQIASTNYRGAFHKAGYNLEAPLTLNDANVGGTHYDVGVEASNARQCLGTAADIGYVGTLNSGAAQASEGVINRGGMAMVSPANTNPVLTSPLARDRGIYEPLYLSHKLKYPTYYRVVNTDSLQGPVGALYAAKHLGIKTFFLVDDQQTYGAGLATHFATWATNHLGMKEVGSGHLSTASAASIASSAASIATSITSIKPPFVYCGCDEPYSGPMEKAARRAGYTGYYMGGDAINDVSFGTFAGGNANLYKTYSTTVGDPTAKTSAGTKFRKELKKVFPGWVPGPYDGFSYDASNIILQATLKSINAHTFKGSNFQRRSSILKYIAGVKWAGTSTPIQFDKNGDLKARLLTVWTWSSSSWSLIAHYNSSNIPKAIKSTP